jgi:hypothetical protein
MKEKYNHLKKLLRVKEFQGKTVIWWIAAILLLLAAVLAWQLVSRKTQEQKVVPQKETEIKISTPAANLGPYSGHSNEAKKKILAKVTKKEGDEVVFTTDGVKVIYLIRNDVFNVAISKRSFEEKKKVVEDWFKSFGLTQADLCRFSIRFAATREVKFPLSNIDSAPTGCRVEVNR